MSLTIDFKQRENLAIEESLPWLAPIQASALKLFQKAPLPHRKVEHWKYNKMSFLTEKPLVLAKQAKQPQDDLIKKSRQINFEDVIEMIFINGHLVSSIELVDGLKITKFSDANDEQKKIIQSNLDPDYDAKNLFNNLNHAVSQNGFLVQVEKNTIIQKPLYIRYIEHNGDVETNDSMQLSNHQLIVDLASSSQLTLIEHFESALNKNDKQSLALQQTSISLDNNSRLSHYRLNLESESAHQVSQVKTMIGQDAFAESFYLGLGSRLNRTDIDTIHAGKNGESAITGIYLPSNEQSIDYHSNLEHRLPHCNSHEVFRGIVADRASATFNGKIHIFQDAQKSDAYLNNKNLLLTNQAEVNTKPELEIYADDVSCAHGATVAQLDDKSVYYLQTRGISKEKAKKMLSIAFIQALLNQVKLTDIKSFLIELLDEHMSKIK